jgi:preprotein translocase subunit SecF
MIRFFANANYDFIGSRKRAFIGIGAFVALGVVALLTRGINYSIEFTGGTMVRVQAEQPAPIGDIRDALEAAGLEGSEITPFGDAGEYVIRARTAVEGSDADNTSTTTEAVSGALDQVFGAGQWVRLYSEAVGPKVGGELRTQAFFAIFLSFFAVLAYLAYRFEWRFGVAAVAATIHDVTLSILFISIMNIEVGLVVVAAILSTIGYSLNDTIVIFDRIRENMHEAKRGSIAQLINRSINETLPRTIFTNGTVFLVLLSLLIFGGTIIRPFAWVMVFGSIVGTFSTLFIATPALLLIEERWPGLGGRGVTVGGKVVPKARPETV